MIVDKAGYRLNVGIILLNASNRLFWGKRVGHDAWQFPQGGLGTGETLTEAMFRELREEVGLEPKDVEIVAVTKRWHNYRLPKQFLRTNSKPLVIGQKQKWYLLRILCSDQKIRLDLSDSPEFDSWRWIDFSEPQKHVIFFKKQVYVQVLKEFEHHLKKRRSPYGAGHKRGQHSR